MDHEWERASEHSGSRLVLLVCWLGLGLQTGMGPARRLHQSFLEASHQDTSTPNRMYSFNVRHAPSADVELGSAFTSSHPGVAILKDNRRMRTGTRLCSCTCGASGVVGGGDGGGNRACQYKRAGRFGEYSYDGRFLDCVFPNHCLDRLHDRDRPTTSIRSRLLDANKALPGLR